MKQHGSLAVDVLQAAVEQSVKREGAGMIWETFSGQSLPLSLSPPPKCVHTQEALPVDVSCETLFLE